MGRLFFLALALASAAWPQIVPGRYIVELADEATANGERLTRVRSRQADARRRVASLPKARVLGTVERVGNSLFVETDDLAALRQMPGVKRVHAVRRVKMHLDRALSLQKVEAAWALVGEERAGAGIKVGIIDSGVDLTHPGLAAAGLQMPAGFPRVNRAADESNTNGKVIVARSYVDLLTGPDPDPSARDRVGHGTALAMIIAGVRTNAPGATIAGVAPRAQIGSYKVFGTPRFNDDATNDAIIKAMDDAVADGMDVINLSLGSDVAPRLEDDPLAQAVERASQAGVIVVVSSGNNGPEFGTLGSPATAPSALAVGASRNGRIFATSAQVDGLPPFVAALGNGPPPAEPLRAPGADVANVDATRQGCSPFPAGSLRGRIAVILRGSCNFSTKLNNAQAAGAVGVMIYALESSPSPIPMDVEGARLPAMMVSASDGARLRERLAAEPEATITMTFQVRAVEQPANRLESFSSIGPGPDLAVKPELVGVGGLVYTATQRLDPRGDMYSADGYILVSGTSFSAPMVAGAAALLKAARPGLTVEQYRSLLINTASTITDVSGAVPAIVQKAGAGQLDVGAAVRSTIAAAPAAISFGAGTADPRAKSSLRIFNLGGTAETYSLQAVPSGDSAAPVVPATATAEGGGSVTIELPLGSSGLRPGAHEGRVRIVASSGAAIEVPYWYAVKGEAALFPVLQITESGRRGALLRDAVLFRVVDAAGVPLRERPELIVRQGDGTATLVDFDADSPGMWGIDWRLGPLAGPNVLRIQVGDKFRDVTILAAGL